MSKPLKTLFLLEDLCFGGTQKQNLALACRLDRERFEPVILTLTGPTDLDETARQADVALFQLGRDRRVPPLFFARLGAYLRELQPDILVPCTALPNIWGRIWGKVQRVPVIVGTVRGGGAPARQHEWLLRRLADGIVCNSQPLADIMIGLGCPPGRVRYIANGVDADHFAPNADRPGGQVIICVARLAADKDHRTLLQAFARIADAFPQAELRLVGEGPLEADLKGFVSQKFSAQLARRIKFLGASDDPAIHLRDADIFALSSIREGQPNVILEAMACGLPVCATSVGGIPQLVTDNGLLSPAGDAAALAANLGALLADPQQRHLLGQNGRKRVESDFSFASMVSRHQDFFLELWSARNRQRLN